MSKLADDEAMQYAAADPSEVAELVRRKVSSEAGSETVVAAVSGGVDSTVAAAIAARELDGRLIPVLIDTGFLRQNEPEYVEDLFRRSLGLELRVLDASQRFYEAVSGLEDAEEKRKAFRQTFYRVLGEFAKNAGAKLLLQGTIAPDWIETTGGIKTQHNVLAQMGVDSVKEYGFGLIEPLSYLYKDQVRSLGRFLGIPDQFLNRQPFPGPGLLVRAVGKVSPLKLKVLKAGTPIVETGLEEYGPSQWFVAAFGSSAKSPRKVLSGTENWSFREKVTGVRGDSRVYGELLGIGPSAKASAQRFDDEVHSLYEERRTLVREAASKKDVARLCLRLAAKSDGGSGVSLVIRAVKTSDFMTADILEPPFPALKLLSERLLALAEEVSDVFYDLTPKPPATIEFE
ncbi:MAG: GMP synthase [Thermoprotei archaeon]